MITVCHMIKWKKVLVFRRERERERVLSQNKQWSFSLIPSSRINFVDDVLCSLWSRKQTLVYYSDQIRSLKGNSRGFLFSRPTCMTNDSFKFPLSCVVLTRNSWQSVFSSSVFVSDRLRPVLSLFLWTSVDWRTHFCKESYMSGVRCRG